MRPSQRKADELRKITLERNYTKYAEGSVLVCFGETKVLCNASVVKGVPRFLKGSDQGWITAEYSMLPRATHDRSDREATRGKQGGRTLEIQRLIARSLRACVDLKKLGDYTIYLDCDVIQADGGTRTAAITGACVALRDAIKYMQRNSLIISDPFLHYVASISVGIYQNEAVLDLDYREDSKAETDMNVVMTDSGKFIEIQGTAEGAPFEESHLASLLGLAKQGIAQLIELQKSSLTVSVVD